MSISLTCPSCGNDISHFSRSPQLIVCPACNTTSILNGNMVEDVGKSAILTESPSIFTVGKTYKHKDWKFTPRGRVRYDYGDGYWDEWFVVDDRGKDAWISVDEGDIAIEALAQKGANIPDFASVNVGESILIGRIRMTVIEKSSCVMIGAQGELPFKVIPNETYDYIDLLGPGRVSFTVEYQSGGVECYKGNWIDPFDIIEA